MDQTIANWLIVLTILGVINFTLSIITAAYFDKYTQIKRVFILDGKVVKEERILAKNGSTYWNYSPDKTEVIKITDEKELKYYE